MEKNETTSPERPWQSYHTVYTNAKAGMEGVNKEKVQKVVYEMSKGSKYFENEERKEAYMRQKIENMRAQCAKLTASDLSHFQAVANKRILELEASRDLSRIWLHVDMDAFFAAVETLSNPSLKGKPMAVGSMSMISTANYEARKFGVRAAMPGFIACKLCPELIFVPTDFKKYTYYSDLTRKVFQKYDHNFMAASLDEAYIDITEVCRERGVNGGEIAEELRTSVYEETGLTCSAGVAPNRLLAKVCSDIRKPNGQFILPADRAAIMTFISSLPIRKIGGIGKVTEYILRDVFGINTCEDMVQKGGLLCALFSHSTADFFLSVGLGLGKTDTPEVRSRKSISSERTFSATADESYLYKKLAELSKLLSTDMQKEGLCGRMLTLKLKTASFEVRTRAVTLQKYIFTSEDILRHASKLLNAELPISLRLIGLRFSQFKEEGALSDPTQKTLANFIITGRDSRKHIDNQNSATADVSDHCFMNHTVGAFSIENNEACHHDFRDILDSSHLPNLIDKCTFRNSPDEMEKIHEPSCGEKLTAVNMVEHTPKLHGDEVSRLSEEDYCPENFIDRSLDRLKRDNILNDEAFSSSYQKAHLFWVDGYKCSLCGFELPPCLPEERQEHSDFHLAERIQEEESSSDSRAIMQRQRFSQMDNRKCQSKRKKHKLSPKEGKHIPIDSFFVKSNQNL